MIDKIYIENFKSFKDSEFSFDKEFNLIVGENGSGKSSILKAIAIAISGWTYAYKKDIKSDRPIGDSEVREVQLNGRYDKAKHTRVRAEGEFPIVDQHSEAKKGYVVWNRERSEGEDKTLTSGTIRYFLNEYGRYHDISYNLKLDTLGSDVLRYIESGKNFDLPLFAFYECDRLWLSKDKIDISKTASRKQSRFDPYIDCFHTGTDSQSIEEWILKVELESFQNPNVSTKKLIQKIAINALEDCTGLQFDMSESRVMVNFGEAKSVPFEHLSDGQRTVLSLFFDIAHRCVIMNPHLGEDVNEQVKGVVLIDELDLHLHPIWQRNIVKSLRNTFPKIQFICTTHSPFILQSVRSPDEIIMLGGEPLSSYFDKSVEDVSVNMGVDRPDVAEDYISAKNQAKTFLEELETADISSEQKLLEFKNKLADISKPYASNPAFQAFLELQLAAKKASKS